MTVLPSTRLGALARRDVLRAGVCGLGLGAVGWAASEPLIAGARAATPDGAPVVAPEKERILVVVELSGANDGLNTVVPYTDDAYYRARPKLGIRPDKLLKLDDRFGLQPTMTGFERLFHDGQLAIVHGVGYDHPSFSHFSSMAYWHTAAPNSGDSLGWLGRLADAMDPGNASAFLVDVQDHESLAVRAQNHVPLVFDNPDKFSRVGTFSERDALVRLASARTARNPSEAFLFDVAASAQRAEVHVRDAYASFKTPIYYGLYRFGLERVAALIAADFPTRIYYASYPHNAFDTHVTQADNHARILKYTSDHIAAFLQDMDRIGRGDDVAVMVFSEFGRRVAENANLGTDHGTAGLAFVAGKKVKGGHYGVMPSLTDLDDGNMRYTTDFRRVYATMISSWMKCSDVSTVLKTDFTPIDLIQS